MNNLSKNQKFMLIAGGGILAFCAFCCVASIILGMINEGLRTAGLLPTETPRPTATATPLPSDTPEPTFTLEPTATPTFTPEPPTVPPTLPPTEAPVEGDTALVTYFDAVSENTANLGEALGQLGQLLTAPRPGEDDWTLQMAGQMVVIRQSHEAIDALDVPPEAQGFHIQLTDATADCAEMTNQLTTAIDNVDETAMNSAMILMQSCADKTATLGEQMEEALENVE